MAICKSATRFDKDSYYETTVDEINNDVVVKGTKNGEPVEWTLGGGSSDNMAILPKLTVTLNIDNTENVDEYGLGNAVGLNNGIIIPATFDPPQTSQVWEGYILPVILDNGDNLFWYAQVVVVDTSYAGRQYELTISNMVNCIEDTANPGTGGIIITDPSQPVSCTVNAVYTIQP